jgi:hypothetical protein
LNAYRSISLRLAVLVMTSLLPVYTAFASNAPDPNINWRAMIKADYPAGCDVATTGTFDVTRNENGYEARNFTVVTCKGTFYYRGEYFPRASFPDHASEYEVHRLQGGAMTFSPG